MADSGPGRRRNTRVRRIRPGSGLSWRAIAAAAAAALAAASVRAAEPDLKAETARFAQMYFAPMGCGFYRLYDPQSGMVEFKKGARQGTFDGAAGWRGAYNILLFFPI